MDKTTLLHYVMEFSLVALSAKGHLVEEAFQGAYVEITNDRNQSFIISIKHTQYLQDNDEYLIQHDIEYRTDDAFKKESIKKCGAIKPLLYAANSTPVPEAFFNPGYQR